MSWHFTIELEREDDGRWIAEIPSLPGVLAYGATEAEAFAVGEALALRVLADRLEHLQDLLTEFLRAPQRREQRPSHSGN